MPELSSEDKKMSVVSEMSSLCHEVADLTTTSHRWKDRVTAAARAIGLTWSRTKDIYYADPKIRPTLEEGDKIRGVAKELRLRRRAHEQALRLHQTVAHLRAVDAEFYGETIAELQRAVNASGILDSPLDEGDE